MTSGNADGTAGNKTGIGAAGLSRVAIRSISEFVTHVCVALIRNFDGDLDLGLLFVTLLRRVDSGEQEAGAAVSINALSRAAARPFETIRRLCNQLCERGLAERTEGGIRAVSSKLDGSVALAVRAAFADQLVFLIAELKRLGYPLRAGQPDAPFDPEAVEYVALDLMLLAMEFGIPPHPHRNWLKPYLYTAVLTANARPFTFDRELALRYSSGDTPPPDSLRRPVGASALARALTLPYATVRRNLEAMTAGGQLQRVAGGYLIEMSWMQSPTSLASGGALVTQLHRLLRRLELAGFPFDAPEKAYVRGEPELIAFG